jgi:hypothetical protein
MIVSLKNFFTAVVTSDVTIRLSQQICFRAGLVFVKSVSCAEFFG